MSLLCPLYGPYTVKLLSVISDMTEGGTRDVYGKALNVSET